MRFDARIHQRLRVARLVSFVVTEPAETDQVEHDVLVELLSIVERDLQDAIRRFGIVAIDVEDRQLSHACDVSRINRRASGFWSGRESDLVVDDDVDRAASAITFETGKVQRFHHDTLSGESRITMQQDGQRKIDDLLARYTSLALHRVLCRTNHSLDNRIHSFEMAGIWR